LYKMKTQNTHTMLVFLKHSLNGVRDNVTLMKNELVVQAHNHERQLDRIFRALESSREWNASSAHGKPNHADVERNHEQQLHQTAREFDVPRRSDDACSSALVKQNSPPADIAQLPNLLPKAYSEPRINIQSETFAAQQSLRSEKSQDVVLPVEDLETEATITDGEALAEELDMPVDSFGFFAGPPRTSPASGTLPLASNKQENTIRTNRSCFADRLSRVQQQVSADHPVQGLAARFTETGNCRNAAATNMPDATRLPPSVQLWATSACSNV